MKLHDFIMNMIRFEESQLILLGGRPAMGKTAFVNSIMAELARNNKCSAFVSLEMSEKMWIERMHTQIFGLVECVVLLSKDYS